MLVAAQQELVSSDLRTGGFLRYSNLISRGFLEIFRLENSEVWLPGSGLRQFEDLGRRGFLDAGFSVSFFRDLE
ncbi:MAG: hypothetical protein GY737_20370 [Desulfobacteraceae bacterium]|nr:hypothetical protein [Desulfobacteraceae bacterium]